MWQAHTQKAILKSQVSLYEKLFPPGRDRTKELEAAQRFKVKKPPCLNGCAEGYKPGWLTSNLILCPANWEYALADWIVPRFYAIGIDTPNKVTLLNCVTLRLASFLVIFFSGDVSGVVGNWLYWCLPILLPLQQMIDCADGQMARRYGLGSEFGAWLDHVTDNAFGVIMGSQLVYKTFMYNDTLWPCFLMCIPLVSIVTFGNYWIQAEEFHITWPNMNALHKTGMYQMMFLSYVYSFTMIIFLLKGWLN
jgi:phosphatidylglycerophosphate synthase